MEPTSNRGVFEKRFASRYVFELLWKEHLRSWTFDLGYFYDQFRDSPITAASARWVFEFRVCQLLREQRTIQVFPIIQGTPWPEHYFYEHYPGKNAVDLQMPGSEEHRPVEGVRSVVNPRYHPRFTAPAIDPLFLIHPPDDSPPIILVFEATQNAEDWDANRGSLRRADALDLKVRQHYVVIALEGTRPKITVPKAYHEVTSVNQPLPKEVLQVFNYPVPKHVLFPQHNY